MPVDPRSRDALECSSEREWRSRVRCAAAKRRRKMARTAQKEGMTALRPSPKAARKSADTVFGHAAAVPEPPTSLRAPPSVSAPPSVLGRSAHTCSGPDDADAVRRALAKIQHCFRGERSGARHHRGSRYAACSDAPAVSPSPPPPPPPLVTHATPKPTRRAAIGRSARIRRSPASDDIASFDTSDDEYSTSDDESNVPSCESSSSSDLPLLPPTPARTGVAREIDSWRGLVVGYASLMAKSGMQTSRHHAAVQVMLAESCFIQASSDSAATPPPMAPIGYDDFTSGFF
ncbi:uncharacterized protein AMSG_10372 [Thecamonas trahens ATCC 50062]|uniref:Uncharacterized protein n=1 Tax=Thecamonas trahens ATCC 50062 TaxID=461836 RepID=A0A0L0DR81_THETB|nr:hypothetical protein AMSG_10372 [Thecamonas trahens ATCC 50062]KNC54526.1 hypothetical protein AMSG_10372 [Thecamonas trahens ATCC 50062]|eukprot:XP_013753543.1 hypothetical protein AMSG_10372 [Thecamonas trahens ATCC 50062]